MTNAEEYLLNKALGKDVNPKKWAINQIPQPAKAPRQWQFPDGSKITETIAQSGELVALEELK